MRHTRTLRNFLLACVILATLPASSGAEPTAHADDRDQRMAWWREARFGMFIHWGVYAVAEGSWRDQPVPGVGEWIMHHGRIPVREYETLAQRFNPAKFDAAAWVRTAREAGMKYIVITSKHHDGFCMFDSKLTTWDIMDATPFKRDVLKELADECRAQGIKLGFYHSIMDWHHPDASSDEHFGRYVEHLHGQVRELLTNYGDVAVMWFDGEWIDQWTNERGRALETFCRELQPGIIINNRVGKGRQGMAGLSASPDDPGDFGTPEQEVPARGFPGGDWESCMTMNNTWGFKRDDENWKPAKDLINTLAETAGKGGNLLLNVGPTAQGEIPAPSIERLAAMGKWLARNGTAVYGTQAGPFEQLQGGHCTRRGDVLHLILRKPELGDSRLIRAPGLRNEVARVWPLLRDEVSLPARVHDGDLFIDAGKIQWDDLGTVINVKIVGEPQVVRPRLEVSGREPTIFAAAHARLNGSAIALERSEDGSPNIGFWTRDGENASWELKLAQSVRCRISLEVACVDSEAGDEFIIRMGAHEVRGHIPPTGSWQQFIWLSAGEIEIGKAGEVDLVVERGSACKGALMNLRRVKLTPVD